MWVSRNLLEDADILNCRRESKTLTANGKDRTAVLKSQGELATQQSTWHPVTPVTRHSQIVTERAEDVTPGDFTDSKGTEVC